MTVGQFLFWYFVAVGVSFILLVLVILKDEGRYGSKTRDELSEAYGDSFLEDTEKHTRNSGTTKGDPW